MTSTAKIGAFFLIVLALLAVLIMKIEDVSIGAKKRSKTYDIRFQNVAGLDDKSAVRIAGVRVGKVNGIRLLPDGTAVARIELESEVEIKGGAYGQIRNMGLLGDKYIELFPGIPDAMKLPDGARIEGTAPKSFDDLTKLAADIGKDVKELTGAFSNSIGGTQGTEKINRIVDNIGELAEALRKMVEANRQNVDVSMANLREFSAEIRGTLARLDQILQENRTGVKGTVANLDEVTGKLKKTADNVNSITTKIDSGDGTIGKLVNSEETHRNLNEALQSVRDGVNALSTTLNRVNRLDIDLGFRAEYLGREGNSKAYFGLDLSPRENKFYRLEFVAATGGFRKDEKESTTVTLPDGSVSVTKKQVEFYEDEFGLSAQIGWRLKNTALRGGLIESRGGAAIDHFLMRDQLKLTLEGWDFGRPGYRGHVKFLGQWKLSPNIYVLGGVDEVINPEFRTPFLGAGLRWKDEDLKGLLGFASLAK